MTLYQLECFALVAKLQSFTKAAQELHVGQSSMSALVIQLQKELGVKLFEKLGVKSHLTEAGKTFLQKTHAILALVQEAKEEMDQVKGMKKGRLAVGGAGFAGTTLLPIAVQAFKKAFPSIELNVIIQPSMTLEEKLLNGQLDVALMSQAPKSPLLISGPYREEEIVAVASPRHPLARRRSVPLELLAQEAIVADGKGGYTRQIVENFFARKKLPFTPALEIDVLYGSRDAIKTAVANGLGIAFLSRHYITLDVQVGRLKVLKIPDFKLKRVMYLVFHKSRQNPSVQIFVRFLQNYREQ